MSQPAAPSSAILSWRAHPARQEPGRCALGLATIAIIALLAWDLGGSAVWAGFTAVALLLVLNRFFLPSRFAVDDDGLTASHPFGTRRVRWRDVRRFGHDDAGAFVSTRGRRTVLDGLSGIHVTLPADAALRARVVEHLETRLAMVERGAASTTPATPTHTRPAAGATGREAATCDG